MNQAIKSSLLGLMIFLAMGTILHAQDKEVIIIEKTVDEEGNEISKKIIRKQGGDIDDAEIERWIEEESFGQQDLQGLGFEDMPRMDWGYFFNPDRSGASARIGVSLSFDDGRPRVIDVEYGSGAAQADIREGDEIVSVEDIAVASYADIKSVLKDKKAGDVVKLIIYRDGQEITKEVELMALPQGFGLSNSNFDTGHMDSLFQQFFGGGSMRGMDSLFRSFDLQDGFGDIWSQMGMMPRAHQKSEQPAERPQLGLYVDDSSGEIIVDGIMPDTPADRADLREGDRITRLNDQVVGSFPELKMVLNQLRKGQEVTIEIERKGKTISKILEL